MKTLRLQETEVTATGARRRWPGIVASVAAGLQAVAIGLAAWLHARAYAPHAPADVGPLGRIGNVSLFSIGFLAFALVGAVIVSRRPRNVVGWVMVGTGAASAVSLLGFSYGLAALSSSPSDPPALALLAAWLSPVTSILTVILGFVILPLVFPDGRLPSSRWRVVLWIAVAFLATEIARLFRPRIVLSAVPIGAEEVEIVDIPNPLVREWARPLADSDALGLPLILVLASAAVAAVVVRFRRSAGAERQQMKWFVAAAGILVLGLALLTFVTVTGLRARTGFTQAAVVIVAFGAYPVAIGVAVLRYRLYEIDRLVSRTVAYGLVVVVLAAVYVGGVVGLGAVVAAVTGSEDSDLAVALATLAVVGLFRPLSSRVRTAVDRRFNRTGYEARAAVEAFTGQTRDEVDLEQLRGQLARTAAVTVQPTHASVWLARRETSA